MTIVRDNAALLLMVEKRSDRWNANLYRMNGGSEHELTPFHEDSAASMPELAGKINPWLENLHFLRSLIGLKNPNPGINLKMTLPKTVFQIGEKLVVTLEFLDQNGAHVDCYVTLVDIDPNGAPRVVFPDKDLPDPNLHDNHLTLATPSTVTLGVGPPTGQETLIAIATRTPLDWSQALTPSSMAGGYQVHEKGVTALSANIQDRPLEEWTKGVVTFVIVDEKDIAAAQLPRRKTRERSKNR